MITNGIIQARMSSTRLPGKALKKLKGKTIIEWIFIRLKKCKSLNNIILATTVHKEDDSLCKLGDKYNIPVVRGNKNNVLSRYVRVIEKFPSDAVVRITGDNPLTDIKTIDNITSYFYTNNLDYCYAAKIPYGSGADIFRSNELLNISKRAITPRHKEHINTYYLDFHLSYTISSFITEGINRSDVRVTLDLEKDYIRLIQLFDLIHKPDDCGIEEIIYAYDRLSDFYKY